MRLIKRIPTIQVKRTFLVADLARKQNLKQAKAKVASMPEKKIDRYIGAYRKRLAAYNAYKWHLAEFLPSELGVWRGAGQLPRSWTTGTLADTSRRIKQLVLKENKLPRTRAASVIPDILKMNFNLFQKEKYLLPITFKHGTGTRGRRGFVRKVRADIDDGNMRSIALTVSGRKKIKAYYGVPANNE